MLNQIEDIYEDRKEMMKKLKKASYKKNMELFREKNGHYFTEMTEYIDGAENKEDAARELAACFVEAVDKKYRKNGKIGSGLQADLNMFTIYYVFPTLLLTGHESATMMADAICEKWHVTFKNSNISYTTYERLSETFREKIFGLF